MRSCERPGRRLDRFLSHADRFDAKVRVSAPKPFRAVLAKEGFEDVFAHPSLFSPALDCGITTLLDEIHGLLELAPPYSRDRKDLATALRGSGQNLCFDTEGRTMLGQPMRASIGLREETMFVGQGRKFQIWEPNRFAACLEEAQARARELRAKTGVPATRGARE